MPGISKTEFVFFYVGAFNVRMCSSEQLMDILLHEICRNRDIFAINESRRVTELVERRFSDRLGRSMEVLKVTDSLCVLD